MAPQSHILIFNGWQGLFMAEGCGAMTQHHRNVY